MKHFLLTFIPILVAMDAIGVLPIFIGFTEHLKKHERRKVLTQSIATAFIVGIIFLFLGKLIFELLGVLVADFKIAGGLVLLAISLRDILQNGRGRNFSPDTVGAVPIGTPLITGPAVLTTMVILLDSYGLFFTVLSFIVNLFLVWITFYHAASISKFLGKAGSRAFSKIASLLLAAIAIMMVRKGVIDTIALFFSKGT